MTGFDWHKVYADPLDAECCHGYFDGRRPDSPEPGINRHPAYIHGFRNGRDDLRGRPSRTAEDARQVWAYIEATCGSDA